MENQHPQDAAPESAEAVIAPTEMEVEASVDTTAVVPQAPAVDKARHPRDLVARLSELYPQTFFTDGRKVRPLAVGILQELRKQRDTASAAGEVVALDLSMQELRRALRFYTQGAAYLRAVARGDARVNLAGEPVGEVTEEQKAHAKARLAELAPKLAKRERPKQTQRKATEGAGDNGEGRTMRPRRARKPGPRIEGSQSGEGPRPRRGKGREKPRYAGASRAQRNERSAPQADAGVSAMSAEEKLNALLEKFGGK